jgi:orotidine-5'-phosphate decarboxylase
MHWNITERNKHNGSFDSHIKWAFYEVFDTIQHRKQIRIFQRERKDMKLQIATDIANTETVFSIADAVHDVIDILEVGTPVITKEGLVPVYHVKLRYPNLCVFADTNIIDGEAMECEDACKAHADIVM